MLAFRVDRLDSRTDIVNVRDRVLMFLSFLIIRLRRYKYLICSLGVVPPFVYRR